ncbi:hypothetical protein [Aeromicrobium sp. UC242_57]|uniref:hypothetical protein n=1 Tax=Aeromicrobium sp. UC242_57 TaxID=3374624 RepID=UPI0037C10B62
MDPSATALQVESAALICDSAEAMTSANTFLADLRANAVEVADELAVLRLRTIVEFASLRACHLIPHIDVQLAPFDSADLLSRLEDVHERLLPLVSRNPSVDMLMFIEDVGTVGRELRRYVQSH